MNTHEGYSKKKLDNDNVLLAGGGEKSLADFLGGIRISSSKIQYKAADSAAAWTDLITLVNTDENVKQTPKTDNVNRPLMMINGGTSTRTLTSTSMFSTGIYANASTKMITAAGFIKTGSDSFHVLLGDGGHKAISDFATSDHNHDGRYSYAHQSDWAYNVVHNSDYVTFDKNNGAGGPTTGWYNGFVTTHNNYLSSYIVNLHRSADWYVGYSETGENVNVSPTWYKLIHSGNYTNYVNPRATSKTIWGLTYIDASGNFLNVDGLCYVTANSNTLTIGSQNTSYMHFSNSADIPFWFNKSINVNGAIWRYNTNYGITSDGYFHAKAVYANRDGDGGYGGISLYSNTDPNTYGIIFRTTANRGKWGDVQSDWATYFTMNNSAQRGWIWQAGTAEANMSAALSVRGVFTTRAVGNSAGYLAFPQNNSYYTSTATITGALKIVLPRYKSNCMIMFDVNIFTYDETTSNMVTYRIGGYEYGDSGWYAPISKVFSYGRGDKVNLSVRFGYDGSKTCVTIGETNTTWKYPQVSITNVTYGHSDVAISSWGYGWDISFTTTLPSSVSTTFADPYFNSMYWANQRVSPTPSTTTTPTVKSLSISSQAQDNGIYFDGGSWINNISTSVIFRNATIRFGGSGWDWNAWAGLNFDGNTTINIGMPNNSHWTANSNKTAGTIRTVSSKIEIFPDGNSNFGEGLRIHSATNGWTTLILCGTDNTGFTGTSANSWSLHNYGGDFYLNKYNSNGVTGNRLWARSGGGFTFGNTANASYMIESAGDIRTAAGWFRSTGDAGWYSETYGGGIYMVDSTYVRVYNSKRFLTDATAHFTSAVESNSPSDAAIEIRERGRGATDIGHSMANAPRIGFHWSGRYWANFMYYDNWFRCVNSEATGYVGIVANGFYHPSYASGDYLLTSDGGVRHISTVAITSIDWVNVTNKLHGGNEFNIVHNGFNSTNFWFNYLPWDNRNGSASISMYILGDGNRNYADVTAKHFYDASDIRLKKDIKAISNIFPIREFNWIKDGSKSYGFIAQELLELGLSELVKETENDGMLVVNYQSALCLYLAQLSNIVEKQLEEINKLKSELLKFKKD